VLDPWETELPEHGDYEFEDLETGEKIQAHVQWLRESYRRLVEDWRSQLKHRCAETGIDWIPCRTTDPLRGVLIEYLLRRSLMF
jgi:uncharacterized protein (DUF58 family)